MDYNFHFAEVATYRGDIIQGALLTLRISAISIVLGTALGILCALLKTSAKPPVVRIINAYVEIIRNTPFLVQLFIIYFGLPLVGLRFDASTAAIIAMTVNLGAYATEIVRAGLESIRPSQIEAGAALGLTNWQIFRYVMLPPSLARVYPSLEGQYVLILLGSSLASSISATELTTVGGIIDSTTFRSFEVYIVLSIAYLLITVLAKCVLRALRIVLIARERRDVLRILGGARS